MFEGVPAPACQVPLQFPSSSEVNDKGGIPPENAALTVPDTMGPPQSSSTRTTRRCGHAAGAATSEPREVKMGTSLVGEQLAVASRTPERSVFGDGPATMKVRLMVRASPVSNCTVSVPRYTAGSRPAISGCTTIFAEPPAGTTPAPGTCVNQSFPVCVERPVVK